MDSLSESVFPEARQDLTRGRPHPNGAVLETGRDSLRSRRGDAVSQRKRPGRPVPWRFLLVLLSVLAIPVAIRLAQGPLTRQVSWGPGVSQPVAFNHRLHTEDLELECESCHPYVRAGAHAGLPEDDVCRMCHGSPQGESEESARVTEILTAGGTLRFRKLFVLPDNVFYTHRRHVGIADLECSNCHGSIAQTERSPARPLVRMTMNACMDCHRDTGHTLDCNACHR